MSSNGPPLNSMGREERQQLLELAKAKRRAREVGGRLPTSPGRRVHPMAHSLQANEAATAKLEQELAAKTDEAARVRILSLPAAEFELSFEHSILCLLRNRVFAVAAVSGFAA
jgi:hypothetical protein